MAPHDDLKKFTEGNNTVVKSKPKPKLLIINGVTGALGHALLNEGVRALLDGIVIYGLSRKALPWRQFLREGATTLPCATLVASIGPDVSDEASIRSFVGAIDTAHFSGIWYAHAVGYMPFEVDDHGRTNPRGDVDEQVMNLTGRALPRMANALAEAVAASGSPAPVSVVTFGALSDVWEVTAHRSWIESMKVAKASLLKAVNLHPHLSCMILNISSVICPNEIITRPFVCVQANALLQFWISPSEVASKCISFFETGKGGTCQEEDFFHPLPGFDVESYFEDSNFTRKKFIELYSTVPKAGAAPPCLQTKQIDASATSSTVAYYNSDQVQSNYHSAWGQDNMHIGIFPHLEDTGQPKLSMAQAADLLSDRIADLLHLEPDSVVLDLGCGFGQNLASVVKRGPCRGVGLDLSPSLVAKARERYVGGSKSEQLSFVVGSYVDLPSEVREPREAFTHAMSVQALLYGFKHIDRILSQLHRVLAPGARLCLSEFLGTEGEISETMRRNFYDRVQLEPLLSLSQLRAALKRAGFAIELEEACHQHAQEGYRQLGETARALGLKNPDGSSLSDAYRATSECIAEGQLELWLIVAVRRAPPNFSVPSAMTAVVTVGHGGEDKLVLETAWPTPTPSRGEVLVRVHACSLNNFDINTRTGWYNAGVTEGVTAVSSLAGFSSLRGGVGSASSWGGSAISFPRIQGTDVAGVLVAVGESVDPARVGERVVIDMWFLDPEDPLNIGKAKCFASEMDGGFAQYTVVPSTNAIAVNAPRLSFVQLSTFPCAFTTAESLISRTDLVAGETVVISGASGGVGSAAVQLCRLRNARTIIAIANPKKSATLLELGASAVVDRFSSDLASEIRRAAEGGEVDVALDVVGGATVGPLLDVLKPGGRYASSGAIAGPNVELDLRKIIYKDLRVSGATVQQPGLLRKVMQHVERGELKAVVARCFPLAEVRSAQNFFTTKDFVGKIVLTVRDDEEEQEAPGPATC